MLLSIFISSILLQCVAGIPGEGKFSELMSQDKQFISIDRTLFRGTHLKVFVECESLEKTIGPQEVKIGWVMRETKCWKEYLNVHGHTDLIRLYYEKPQMVLNQSGAASSSYERMDEVTYRCDGSIVLDTVQNHERHVHDRMDAGSLLDKTESQVRTRSDGDYLFILRMYAPDGRSFKAHVSIEFYNPVMGYLSFVDRPLLTFYRIYAFFYLLLAFTWILVCVKHFKDLLRIQYCIGMVVLLGLLEKSLFYAEYKDVNVFGNPHTYILLLAEFVSCAKRTVARLLVIIVSVGYGIVKPRLGTTLQNLIGVGWLYFVLAFIESHSRVTNRNTGYSADFLVTNFPLAVLDSILCLWVMSALSETNRTLRLRRNLVKISLYQQFTNCLLFCIVASLIYLIYNFLFHQLEICMEDFQDLWLDVAFWHFLFSFVLTIIMFLWRPSQNNQRYAFTPLLDNQDETFCDNEDLDERSQSYLNEKIVLRASDKSYPLSGGVSGLSEGEEDDDDELQAKDPIGWAARNTPHPDIPLPVLDSDEENDNTKREVSKLQ